MPGGSAYVAELVPRSQVVGVIRDLRQAHAALDVMAALETDAFLQAIRRAQEYTYRRTAELLAAQAIDPTWDYSQKLRWYTENWASIERVARAESGYNAAVRNYVAGYDRLAGMAERTLAAGLPRVSGEFTRLPKKWIEFVKRRDYAWFDMLGDQAIKKLDETVLWNVLAGRSPGGLLQELKGTITGSYKWGKGRGLYEWHAGTYARTAHHRAVATWKSEKAAELGLEWRIYIGPGDSKTRNFCLEHLGGAFTAQEIEQMDNGQTGNVLVDRGGWNCRHDWDPVDKELAQTIRTDSGTAAAVQEELQLPMPKPKAPKPSAPAAPPGPRLFNSAPVEGWAEASTLEEAEAWAMAHDLADVAKYTGLDIRAANDINRVVGTMLREFPEARSQVRFLGAFAEHRAFSKRALLDASMRRWDKTEPNFFRLAGRTPKEIAEERLAFLSRERLSVEADVDRLWSMIDVEGVMGYSEWTKNTEGLSFAERLWGPAQYRKSLGRRWNMMRAELKEYKKTGIGQFDPPGVYSLEDNVAHEFGHALEQLKDLRHDPDFTFLRLWSYKMSRDTVSDYAAQSGFNEIFSSLVEEFWANGATATGMRPETRRLLEMLFEKYGVVLKE